MARGSLVAVVFLFLCAHPLKCEDDSDVGNSLDNFISEWTEFVTDLVGHDMLQGISQLLDGIYAKVDKQAPQKNQTLEAAFELVKKISEARVGSMERVQMETALQTWLLENMLYLVLQLEENSPDLDILLTIRRHIEKELQKPSSEGIIQVATDVKDSMAEMMSGASPVVKVVLEESSGGIEKREVHNKPDPFDKVSKLSAPYRFLKDLVLAAKTDVVRFLKNSWRMKTVMSKIVIGKVVLVVEKLKALLFGGVDLYKDVKKYLLNEILAPLDFISSKLSKTTPEKCLMHHFCVYGARFLKLQEKYPILAKVAEFFPKQKFPVIFLDDLLKSKDKLSYNPNLATALMHGKEKGECKGYPNTFC